MIITSKKKKIKSLRKFVRSTSINYIQEKENTVLKLLSFNSIRKSKGMVKFKQFLMRRSKIK